MSKRSNNSTKGYVGKKITKTNNAPDGMVGLENAQQVRTIRK